MLVFELMAVARGAAVRASGTMDLKMEVDSENICDENFALVTFMFGANLKISIIR